ncbi:hypothetical protein KoxyNG13_051650 [Klebsiella pasteurii]
MASISRLAVMVFGQAANLILPGVISAPEAIANAIWGDERGGDVTVRAFKQRR